MEQIKVLQQNVNKSHLTTESLISYAGTNNYDILLLQEIDFVHNKIKGIIKQDKVYIPTTNQSNKKTCIIIVNKSLITQQIYVNNRHITACKVKIKNGWLKLASVYFPPFLEREEIFTDINKLINDHNRLVIGGDFNARSIRWGDEQTNSKGIQMENFIDNNNLSLLNAGKQPTFMAPHKGCIRKSIIDLTVCTTDVSDRCKWRVKLSAANQSDHFPIEIIIDEKFRKTISSTKIYTTNPKSWDPFEEALIQELEQLNSCQPTTTNELAELYVKAIRKTCNRHLKKATKNNKPKEKIWKTEDLKILEKRIKAIRRSLANAPCYKIEQYRQSLKHLRQQLKLDTQKAKDESWRKFCSDLTQESAWDPINKILKYKHNPDQQCIEINDITLSPKKSSKYMLNTFFPTTKDITELDYIPDRHLDPPFEMHEMLHIFSDVNKDKTPGLDGLSSIICERVKSINPDLLLSVYNKCLETHTFPDIWKNALIKFIPKPNKTNFNDPKSYRPIGLLSMLSKGLEKLINGRIVWHLETTKTLSDRQFGFRKSNSTEKAIQMIHDTIIKFKKEKKQVILLTIDIEGAFDNVQWNNVIKNLQLYETPTNIINLIISYLKNRIVTTDFMSAKQSKSQQKGCIQGSVLGPLFWNIVINPLLTKLTDEGIEVFAYADDITIIIEAPTIAKLQQKTNKTTKILEDWATDTKMKFSEQKTMWIPMTSKSEKIYIKLQNKEIRTTNRAKILGIIFDKNLKYSQHLKYALNKAWKYADKTITLANKIIGNHPDMYKKLYEGVIIPTITYGLSTWGNILEYDSNKKKMRNIQRKFIIKTSKLYFTTSFNSCWSIYGYTPILIDTAQIRIWKDINIHQKNYDILPGDRPIEKSTPFTSEIHPSNLKLLTLQQENTNTDITIYTDGSKSDNGVGASICVYENGSLVKVKRLVLERYCSVFQAEMLAINKALQSIPTDKQITIFTDSQSSIAALKSRKNNTELVVETREIITKRKAATTINYIKAHQGTEGNEMADICAKQAAKNKTKKDFDVVPKSYLKHKLKSETSIRKLTQYADNLSDQQKKWFPRLTDIPETLTSNPAITAFITGHGYFLAHLTRINQRLDPTCNFCCKAEQTADHILLSCDYFSRQRKKLKDHYDAEKQKTSQKLNRKMILELVHKKDVTAIKYIDKIYKKCKREIHKIITHRE